MKRLLCIILTLVIALTGFTACSNNNEQPDIEPASTIISEPESLPTTTDDTDFQSDKYAVKAIEDNFSREMDEYIVPEVELDSDSAVSNAVIKKTKITVNGANKEICDITVSYPDIEKEFLAALNSAGEYEAAADTALYALAQRIENDEIPLTEKNFVLDVVYSYNIYDVVRTAEFTDALMGGMYILDKGVLE